MLSLTTMTKKSSFDNLVSSMVKKSTFRIEGEVELELEFNRD